MGRVNGDAIDRFFTIRKLLSLFRVLLVTVIAAPQSPTRNIKINNMHSKLLLRLLLQREREREIERDGTVHAFTRAIKNHEHVSMAIAEIALESHGSWPWHRFSPTFMM